MDPLSPQSSVLSPLRRVAVIGAGLMGHGIALEFALAGHDVRLVDTDEARLAVAVERLRANLRLLVEAGLVTAERAAGVPEAIRRMTALDEAVADADLVVEAVFEDLAVKRAIFRDLDRLCPPQTILASNTSSFMPSALASATARPDRVLVAHYFNPPHLIPLVEVVRGAATADATVETVVALLRAIGKAPVVVQKEVPGFIGNRLQSALGREAQALVEQGIATPQDIDTVVKTGFGRRLAVAGPFELNELIGLNLSLAVAEQIMPTLASRPEVPPLLREKVARGDLGVKTGRGFYDWTPAAAEALRERIGRALIAIARWEAGNEQG